MQEVNSPSTPATENQRDGGAGDGDGVNARRGYHHNSNSGHNSFRPNFRGRDRKFDRRGGGGGGSPWSNNWRDEGRGPHDAGRGEGNNDNNYNNTNNVGEGSNNEDSQEGRPGFRGGRGGYHNNNNNSGSGGGGGGNWRGGRGGNHYRRGNRGNWSAEQESHTDSNNSNRNQYNKESTDGAAGEPRSNTNTNSNNNEGAMGEDHTNNSNRGGRYARGGGAGPYISGRGGRGGNYRPECTDAGTGQGEDAHESSNVVRDGDGERSEMAGSREESQRGEQQQQQRYDRNNHETRGRMYRRGGGADGDDYNNNASGYRSNNYNSNISNNNYNSRERGGYMPYTRGGFKSRFGNNNNNNERGGNNNYRNYNDNSNSHRGDYCDESSHTQQQSDVPARDRDGAVEVSGEGSANTASRRTVRAPHLRKNCHDESTVLELFAHHHKQKGISLDNYANIPVEMMPRDVAGVSDFGELDVLTQLAENIERCGYKKPTPVQRYGIPVALAGHDLMACAQTGSGKTAAFLIPVVQHILVHGVSPEQRGVSYPIALVMAPTRELALQIYDEVRKLTFRTDIFHDVVYGGTSYPTRFENDILIACPGRLKDIFDRGSVAFKAIKFLILDEADRMLEMGFEEQIEYLVASRYTDMPNVDDRQTLMFSATFPQRILNLAKRYLRRQYYLLTVGRVGSTTKNITQIIEKVSDEEKMDRLFELIYAHKRSDLVLIFVETKKAAEDLHYQLRKEHIPSSTIHGDRRQQDRERALADFKSGETPILVATDVASRGLDIPDVAHVIQYDLPNEMDDYTHRIGRTARAGNKGTATAFYNRNSRKLAVDLYKYLNEHDQNVPSWLRQEVEMVEGEALLSRVNGMGGGGGRRRGGGGGGGRDGLDKGAEEGSRRGDVNATWGEAGEETGRGGRARGGGTSKRACGYNDGGF